MHASILCYHLPGHTPGDLPVFGGLSPPPPRYTVRDNEVILGVLVDHK